MPDYVIPENHRSAIPYLIVADASAAIKFYSQVFQAEQLVCLSGPDGKVAHAELKFAEHRIMVADEYSEMGYKSPKTLGGSAVSILVYVTDVDQTYASAINLGASAMMPVSDQFDGDRRGTIIDPYGHIWLLASRRENISYEEMQARFDKLMRDHSQA